MYGQKQIIQCAAVAIILFVLSFHRSAIKQNKAMAKAKLRRLNEMRAPKIVNQLKENDRGGSGIDEKRGIELTYHSNLTGYCLKNPFGKHAYFGGGNYDNNQTYCHHNCFDTFETWLHRRCRANCCVHKCTASIACQLNIDSVRKLTTIHSKATRIRENNALIVYVGCEVKGAGLYNINQQRHQRHHHHHQHRLQQQHQQNQQKFELMKMISDPINEQANIEYVRSQIPFNLSNEHECQNRHFNQLIRKNTTSVKLNKIKLETNYSHQIMEYHDFLFDMGLPEPKRRTPSESGKCKN